jgi:hypothetical protein
MTDLLSSIRQQLNPATIQQISRTLGADPATTSSAVSMALPALLGGLSQNASNPQGAAALNTALDAHDGSILDNLGGLLGGAAASGIGGAILGHIFGPKRGAVEQGVGKASGLNAQQVAQLLAILAPIVMGVLGRAKQQSNLDASRLPDVLQQTTQQMQTESPSLGGLAGMFDQNHDGQIADDVARIGSSVLGGLFKK